MSMFLLFAGVRYYPRGGMGDYQGSFTDLDTAIAAIDSVLIDSWQGEGEPYFRGDFPFFKPVWAQVAEVTPDGARVVHEWKGDPRNEYEAIYKQDKAE